MDRRVFLSGLAALLTAPQVSVAAQGKWLRNMHDPAWISWKSAFLAADGRVIDHLQQAASHSEGQGYGLLLAVHHGDLAAFRDIRRWTSANLFKRDDALMNWKLHETADRPDPMNATDGDVFYAWALALGADRFNLPDARQQAITIARAISDKCIKCDPRDPKRLVLMPAAEGFQRGTKAILNPSYIMPRALHDLATLAQDDRLAQAAVDGLRLLDDLAKQALVPNWAEVDAAGIRPSSEHDHVFGYDALRVALYLIWSGKRKHLAVQRAKDLYDAETNAETPVVTALITQTVQDTSSYAGFAALRDLVQGKQRPADHLNTDQGYYPATLEMLCRVAARESGPALHA